MDTIEHKLTNVRRVQRLSCCQLLEVMKDWTIDKELIKSDGRFGYYLKKFQENTIEEYDNNCRYFSDILNFL